MGLGPVTGCEPSDPNYPRCASEGAFSFDPSKLRFGLAALASFDPTYNVLWGEWRYRFGGGPLLLLHPENWILQVGYNYASRAPRHNLLFDALYFNEKRFLAPLLIAGTQIGLDDTFYNLTAGMGLWLLPPKENTTSLFCYGAARFGLNIVRANGETDVGISTGAGANCGVMFR